MRAETGISQGEYRPLVALARLGELEAWEPRVTVLINSEKTLTRQWGRRSGSVAHIGASKMQKPQEMIDIELGDNTNQPRPQATM